MITNKKIAQTMNEINSNFMPSSEFAIERLQQYRNDMHIESVGVKKEIGRLICKAGMSGLDSKEEYEFFTLKRRLDNLNRIVDIVDHIWCDILGEK